MYDLPSRTDVGTVVINEAVIQDKAEPEYQAERQQKTEQVVEEKVDLRILDSKSA